MLCLKFPSHMPDRCPAFPKEPEPHACVKEDGHADEHACLCGLCWNETRFGRLAPS
jgi:hypothetical protein